MKYILVTFLLVFAISLTGCSEKNSQNVTSLPDHIHGIAFDIEEPDWLYIATHKGLFLLSENQDLRKLGDSEDDYMGFSIHPKDSQIFFSSGHPKRGGNLGVLRSSDGGNTWEKIAEGDPSGPVDFHAMGISAANPLLLYGWYGGEVYRSEDGGMNWKILPGKMLITSFGTDPKNENIVYAGTRNGLLKSVDKGENWRKVYELPSDKDSVIDVKINPKDSSIWIASSGQGILHLTQDASGIFTKSANYFLPDGAVPRYLAFPVDTSKAPYAADSERVYRFDLTSNSYIPILGMSK